jgi:hypothetical protein
MAWSSQGQEVCPKKNELLRKWADACRAYSIILAKTIADGEPISDGIHLAQRACDNARAAYDAHRKKHGC